MALNYWSTQKTVLPVYNFKGTDYNRLEKMKMFNIDRGLTNVSTAGKRNEKSLTTYQIDEAISYAVKLGMPKERIYYSEKENTFYGSRLDILIIGTDVAPLKKRAKNPNSNVSLKGAIAHEIVGHRDAALGGLSNENDLLEEVQASIRDARFAPDLNRLERYDLLKDAIHRLKSNGIH